MRVEREGQKRAGQDDNLKNEEEEEEEEDVEGNDLSGAVYHNL